MLLKANIKHLTHFSIQNFREWFLSHAESFYTPDSACQYNIMLKRNHSLRVSSLSGLISKKIHLSEEDIILAKIIGLLHDVGRFEQFMI
jgi:HD superfamily phosphodiesterase